MGVLFFELFATLIFIGDTNFLQKYPFF